MIGVLITKLLNDSAALLALVDSTDIYPYIINEDTELPAMIYTIDGTEAEYSKDGWAYDTVSFSVSAFTNDYASLQAIVAEIRDALEWESGTYLTYTYWNIMLTSLSEGYSISENVYMNKLSFEVKITTY